jgi:endonuclease/exonuclease/phosphatase family metal-dependent hydrolase
MTWNIHGGIGLDAKFDLDRIVGFIARHAPDVVALQEVDSRRRPPGDRSPFAFLRDSIGHHGIEAKSITTMEGDYGQIVMSRWPFVTTEIHDISFGIREPRHAIQAEIRTPAGGLRVIASHFGLKLAERRSQARRLVELAHQHPTTTVMLGDFNDWLWPGSIRAALERELPAHTRHATFPSRLPILALDRVYCWPADALRHSFVDRRAWRASDHLPLLADIGIKFVDDQTDSGSREGADKLSEDQRTAIEASKADVRRGEPATDAEVKAAHARFRK